jgi:hypothetical protein
MPGARIRVGHSMGDSAVRVCLRKGCYRPGGKQDSKRGDDASHATSL